MKKTLTADFSKGNEKAYVRGLYQHDYGAILKVTGIEYAEIIRVDFAGPNDEKAYPVVALQESDGGFCVKIPKENTDKAGELSAYIYITDAESGFTIKEVILPIIERVEADPDPSGEKTDPFADVIEEIKKNAKSASDSAASAADSAKSASESATRAEKSAVESQESAQAATTSEKAAATSATAAAESESRSRESATIARSAADQAAKSATDAAESTTTATQLATNAAQSATNASGSAKSADQSAETAKTAADAAGKSASSAQQASRSAAESASTATAAAQTATTAAGKASESATSAVQAAETAGQKATAAETSANNAAESAMEAAKSATAAGDSASAAKTSETAAEEAAQTAQEQADRIEESAEQIEKNKAGVAALEEGKADKTTLAVAERKLDALWKLNQGVSYQFEKNSDAAYQKEVPTGAKLASVKRIGGKTIVWNQLFENPENERTQACKDANNYVSFGWYDSKGYKAIIGHTYLVSFECYMERIDTYFGIGVGYYIGCGKLNNNSNTWSKIKKIVTTRKLDYGNNFYIFYNAAPRTMEIGEEVKTRNVNVFDLTKMFGPGNEPGTVETFEAIFPKESYPYNVGELLSAGVSEVVEQGKNLLDVSNITDVDVDGKGSIRQGVIIPVVKGTYKISALKAENNIFVKRVVGNNYATPADLSSKEVSLTFDANGSIYVYTTGGKIEGVQVEKGSVVTQYSPYHKNTYPVLEAVRQLPGYGWSAGNAYNYVDFEGKKYHKKVEKFQFNKLKFHGQDPSKKTGWNTENTLGLYAYWNGSNSSDNYHATVGLCNNDFAVTSTNAIHGHDSTENCVYATTGYLCVRITRTWAETTLKITESSSSSELISAVTDLFESNDYVGYFELAEEEIIDISDLIGGTFQEPFEVEAGGTLTFKNSNDGGFQIPVPSEEEYIVSLTEVGGVTE